MFVMEIWIISSKMKILLYLGYIFLEYALLTLKRLMVWVTFRTGNAARSVAEPYKKNLFLQSLSEEDHDDSGIPASDSKEGDSSHRRERDKDRIECLENGVNSWTDYSKVQYHPKTLYELKGSWADVNKFDDYGIGRDVIAEGSHAEEMNERLRFFIEECDHIQVVSSPAQTQL